MGAAVPVVPVTDTVKEVAVADGFIARTVSRETLRRAQTPQVFRQELIRERVARPDLLGIQATDDSYLLELLGFKVITVPGEPENIKITCPHDLQIRSGAVEGRTVNSVRIGTGYDLHRLVGGRPLILEGRIEYLSAGRALRCRRACACPYGCAARAAGLKDIGHYFPPMILNKAYPVYNC